VNVRKRIFFTWDGGYVAFNSYEEGREYLRTTFGVLTLQDIPEGWCGVGSNGNEYVLLSTLIHYNNGKMWYA